MRCVVVRSLGWKLKIYFDTFDISLGASLTNGQMEVTLTRSPSPFQLPASLDIPSSTSFSHLMSESLRHTNLMSCDFSSITYWFSPSIC